MSLVGDFFGKRKAVRTIAVAPYTLDAVGKYRFDEFISLCQAAELEPIGVESQFVREPHPGTYFREGFLERLAQTATTLDTDLIAVDRDLTPVQQRQLEERLGRGVLDRSAIILTIFGKRAQSREGKRQVELAQYQYLLPRLKGMWQHFDREKGGIGMRGAGEKQIELDRRLIMNEIAQIKRELKVIEQTRHLHRTKRRETKIPQVAIIGYTNVGKSSLLQYLSQRDVFVKDMPFATLDPLTRRIELEDGLAFLVTDTVGFVQDLPHGLVEAFKSTLEETLEAHLYIQIFDAAAPNLNEQIFTTQKVLEEIAAPERPTLYVFNKMDMVHDAHILYPFAAMQPQIKTSIAHGQGVDAIVDWLRHQARHVRQTVAVRIPLAEAAAVAQGQKESIHLGHWEQDSVIFEIPATSVLLVQHPEWQVGV